MEVIPVKPNQAIYNDKLYTTAAYVINRRVSEVIPNEQTEFKSGGNDRIEINISSSNEYWDSADSFVKFELSTTGSGLRSLDEGGVHSLFREIRLETQSGILIEKWEHYNRLYAIVSNLTHSKSHVDLVEHSAFDSVGKFPYNIQNGYSRDDDDALKVLTGTAASSTTSTVTLTIDAGDAVNELAPGDLIYFEVNDGANVTGTYIKAVVSITNATTVVLESGFGVNLTAGQITSMRYRKLDSNSLILPMRHRGAVNTGTCTMKLPLGFLNQKQWIPLKYIKQGLKLIFQLERPEFCLNQNLGVNQLSGQTDLSYSISKFKYVCSMFQLEQSLDEQVRNMYMTTGIKMPFIGYKWHSRAMDGSGNVNVQVNFGVKSARYVLATLMATRISKDYNQAAQCNDSISTFISGNLSKYQFKIGADEFPRHEVSVDTYAAEAFNNALLTFGKHGSIITDVRFEPHQWMKVNTINSSTSNDPTIPVAVSNESTKLVLSTRLDRDDNNFNGADLTVSPLDASFTFEGPVDAALGSRELNLWLGYDVVLSLSANDGVLVRS
jgi:hypothetical protein